MITQAPNFYSNRPRPSEQCIAHVIKVLQKKSKPVWLHTYLTYDKDV